MNSSHVSSALESTQLIRSGFLSDEDRQALAEIAAAPRSLKAGVDLVSEGVRTDSIHLLTSGWACRYKTTRDGARQIIGLVVPSDICNLDSFMLDKVDFGVRTLSMATAVGLSRDRVRALGAERPGITRAFTWFAIVENAILGEWALSLGRQTALQRLARLLCELSMRLGDGHGDGAGFKLPVTQEQLADILGMTAVHVNRMMKQLRADSVIVAEGRQITVPDMAELCRVGGFDGSYLHAAPSNAETAVNHLG